MKVCEYLNFLLADVKSTFEFSHFWIKIKVDLLQLCETDERHSKEIDYICKTKKILMKHKSEQL